VTELLFEFRKPVIELHEISVFITLMISFLFNRIISFKSKEADPFPKIYLYFYDLVLTIPDNFVHSINYQNRNLIS